MLNDSRLILEWSKSQIFSSLHESYEIFRIFSNLPEFCQIRLQEDESSAQAVNTLSLISNFLLLKNHKNMKIKILVILRVGLQSGVQNFEHDDLSPVFKIQLRQGSMRQNRLSMDEDRTVISLWVTDVGDEVC